MADLPTPILDEKGRYTLLELGRGFAGGIVVDLNGQTIVESLEFNPLDEYAISDIDEDGDTKYYGFLKKGSEWFIMRIINGAVRYKRGDSGYDWDDRANGTYDLYSNVFLPN